MKDSSTAALVAAFVIFLAISGTFSLIETAILTFSRNKMKRLKEAGAANAQLLLEMTQKIDKLLSTILLCNNLANVMVATVATVLVVRWFGDEEHVIIAGSFAVTAIILVFSEITPKALGVRHAMKASLLVARPLWWIIRALTPIVLVAERIVTAMLRLVGTSTESPYKGNLFGLEDLRSVVKDAENLGEAEESHRDMLVNVIDIKDISAEDIMVPKKDVFMIGTEDSEDSIIGSLKRTQFAKIPVYSDGRDDIVGIIQTKEILAAALGGEKVGRCLLRRKMQPPLFIPAQAGVLNLLGVFKQNPRNIGIVVSEYGETIGIVSTSDLLTEIAGQESHALPPTHTHSRYETDADGSHIVDGAAQIREINRRLGLDLPVEGAKTLNGLVHGTLADLPETPCCLEISGVRMEVRPSGVGAEMRVKILRPEGKPPQGAEAEAEAAA